MSISNIVKPSSNLTSCQFPADISVDGTAYVYGQLSASGAISINPKPLSETQSAAVLQMNTNNESEQYYAMYASNGTEGGLVDGQMQLFSYNNSSNPIANVFSVVPQVDSSPPDVNFAGNVSAQTLNATNVVSIAAASPIPSGGDPMITLTNGAKVTRWNVGVATAETGSGNTGCDFNLYSYDDTGAYLGNPMSVKRSNGNVVIAGNLQVGGLNLGSAIPTNNYVITTGVQTIPTGVLTNLTQPSSLPAATYGVSIRCNAYPQYNISTIAHWNGTSWTYGGSAMTEDVANGGKKAIMNSVQTALAFYHETGSSITIDSVAFCAIGAN